MSVMRFVLLLTAILAPALAGAQPPGATVRGLIVDASGGVTPDVTVTITSRETGLVRTTQTAADGQYAIASLPAGSYRLEVAQTGFKTHLHAFDLFVGQELRLDVRLELGGASEQVRVEGTRVELERDSAEVDRKSVV